jgi:hypothetical protein
MQTRSQKRAAEEQKKSKFQIDLCFVNLSNTNWFRKAGGHAPTQFAGTRKKSQIDYW